MTPAESAPGTDARADAWQLPRRRLDFAARPLVMGIVNVTPDSFSDGGAFLGTDRAVAHGIELVGQGADILDVGGESTRPGADPVDAAGELSRVGPVVEALARRVSVPISVDTMKAEVARVCLDLGAEIINDVTGLRGDPAMPGVAARAGAGVVVMHMQGTPQTMQDDPRYDDVVVEIAAFFRDRLDALAAAGVAAEKIALDPGIGFGKTVAHNVQILRRLKEFRRPGRPLCLGVSRKGFLGRLLDRPVHERLAGGLAVLCHALSQGAVQVVRVHDVAPTLDTLRIWQTLGPSEGDAPCSSDWPSSTNR